MTVPPQLGKGTPGGVVRRLLPGQLRQPCQAGWRLLGLAIFVAAASFTVLTASASASGIQRQRLRAQNVRGARSASTSSATQKVHCAPGMGLYRREYACKTPMRLVCHKSPGQTVLRRIPSSAYYAEYLAHRLRARHRTWGANGPP